MFGSHQCVHFVFNLSAFSSWSSKLLLVLILKIRDVFLKIIFFVFEINFYSPPSFHRPRRLHCMQPSRERQRFLVQVQWFWCHGALQLFSMTSLPTARADRTLTPDKLFIMLEYVVLLSGFIT